MVWVVGKEGALRGGGGGVYDTRSPLALHKGRNVSINLYFMTTHPCTSCLSSFVHTPHFIAAGRDHVYICIGCVFFKDIARRLPLELACTKVNRVVVLINLRTETTIKTGQNSTAVECIILSCVQGLRMAAGIRRRPSFG